MMNIINTETSGLLAGKVALVVEGTSGIDEAAAKLFDVATAGGGLYAASKGGLVSLARVAAIEGAARGVRVNVLQPAITRTPVTADAIPQ